MRKQAESAYEQMKTQNKTGTLAQVTQALTPGSGLNPTDQEFAATLLRRLLFQQGPFAEASQELKGNIKNVLIQCLDPSRPAGLRKKASACINEVAGTLTLPEDLTDEEEIQLRQVAAERGMDEDDTETLLLQAMQQKEAKIETVWPELLPTVSQLASHQNHKCRLTAHSLLSMLTDNIPGSLTSHLSSFMQMLQSGMSDGNATVSAEAIKSTSAFLCILRTKEEQDLFQPLVPQMISALTLCLQNIENGAEDVDEMVARNAVESMVMVAEALPTFWRPQLENVWRLMTNIANSENMDEDTRTLAIEFILGLAEEGGGMVRKRKDLLAEFVELLFKMCADVSELHYDTWESYENDDVFGDGAEEDEFATVGEQAFDRISRAVGGKVLFPIAMPMAEAALGSSDWKFRRAGLTALALMAEGCQKAILPNLKAITEGIINFVEDPHHRVRYAAIHCLGQFATDFPGKFQKRCGKRVAAVLVQVIDGARGGDGKKCERLQNCGAKSLQAMSDGGMCKKDVLVPHLQKMLEGLYNLIKNGRVKTKESCITTLSSISTVVEDAFEPFYATFMPLLIEVLQIAPSEENAGLRGRAIECIGFLGGSVRKEVFAPYVQGIMTELIAMLNSKKSAAAVDSEYVMQGCVRICEALRADFFPFMEHILPRIFHTLGAKEVRVGQSSTEDSGSAGDGFTEFEARVSGQGGHTVGINTEAIQAKVHASDTLLQFIIYLDDAYLPYAQQTCSALYPCIETAIIPQVRSSAAAALPSLLRMAVKALRNTKQDMGPAQDLFYQMLKILLAAPKRETDSDTRGTLAQSMCEVSQIAYESGGDNETSRTGFNTPTIGIRPEDLAGILNQVIPILSSSVTRRNHAFSKAEADVDFDEEEKDHIDALTDKEFQLCVALIEVIGCMIKSHGAAFLPVFESILAKFVNELMGNKIPSVRQAGVCFVDDVVEFCGPEAAKYIPMVCEQMLVASADPDHQLRQAAVYGVGIFVEFGGTHFEPFVQKALQVLVEGTQYWIARTAEDPNHFMATNNSISSVGKMILKYPHIAQPAQFWPLVLSWLPLNNGDGDILEAQVVHELIIDQIQENNVHVTGNNFTNLSQLLHIIGGMLLPPEFANEEDELEEGELGNELVTDKTKAKIKAILSSLQQNLPNETTQAFGALPPAKQRVLQSL